MSNRTAKDEARFILSLTNGIRDMWPNDQPYLWEKLEGYIDMIEKAAHRIYKTQA